MQEEQNNLTVPTSVQEFKIDFDLEDLLNLDGNLEDINIMDSYDNEVSSEIYFLAAHGKDTQEMMDELLNSDEYSSFGQIIDVMEEFTSVKYEPNNSNCSDMENLNEDPDIKSYFSSFPLLSAPGTSKSNNYELVNIKERKPVVKLELDVISGNEGSQVNTPDVTKTVMDLQHTFAVPSLVSNN